MLSLEERNHPAAARFLLGWAGLSLAFVWGFGEGFVFFLVPDIIITLPALFSIRKSIPHLILALFGASIAGTVHYLWASVDSAAAMDLVGRVPFVWPEMFTTAAADFVNFGIWAPMHGPPAAIPYKVYAVTAPAHVSLVAFLLISIPARLERLALSWAVFAFVGYSRRKSVDARPRLAILIHLLIWTLFYAGAWSQLRAKLKARYGPKPTVSAVAHPDRGLDLQLGDCCRSRSSSTASRRSATMPCTDSRLSSRSA